MKFLEKFDHIPFFTIEGFRQVWEDQHLTSQYVQTALYRWMKTGKIVRLKKGLYITRGFFEQHVGDEDFLPAMSAVMLPQSYVSLEYVLQRNSILTEVTYPITAITQKNTRTITNTLGTFNYRHIKSELHTGFTVKNYLGIPFSTASLAKALFDFLYLRPFGAILYNPEYDLVEDLRLNLSEFSSEDQEEFAKYVVQSRQRKMERIYENIRSCVWLH